MDDPKQPAGWQPPSLGEPMPAESDIPIGVRTPRTPAELRELLDALSVEAMRYPLAAAQRRAPLLESEPVLATLDVLQQWALGVLKVATDAMEQLTAQREAGAT